MLSVIIAARNEIYLERTIRNILDNARGDIEVIVILDGYLPDPPIDMHDNRVYFYHYPESIGQRAAINKGVEFSKGKYIMKLDAHCAVDEGFDIKLAADCEYDWTVVPRMYNLNHETWQPKLHKRTDYMYISCAEGKLLRAEYYGSKQPKNDKLIDDTMCCMGPGWFMHKDRFIELGGMDENHGGWGQMGVEIGCKAWLSGGKLIVNKKTWFAHWFRGNVGFPYHITGHNVEVARKYSQDLWLNNKWEKATRKFEWMIEKFNPPGWKKEKEMNEREKEIINEFHKLFFKQWNIYTRKWQGVKIVKYPTDLFIYQTLIYENKPDIIIETGSYMGGGSLFFANMCDLVGHGKVISVDLREIKRPKHPRIKYVIGRATSTETMDKLRKLTKDKTVMVVLDSDHRSSHVKRELVHYGRLVTKGQYMIVEDTMLNHPIPSKRYNPGPYEAVQWYMKRKNGFKIDPLEKQFLISMCPHGFLRRVK